MCIQERVPERNTGSLNAINIALSYWSTFDTWTNQEREGEAESVEKSFPMENTI